MSSELPQTSHYILLRTSPPAEELLLRQALQDTVVQAFGLTASMHIDVLWVKAAAAAGDASGRAVVRVDNGEDATRVLAAIVASSAAPRMELIKASSFLPSLLLDDTPL